MAEIIFILLFAVPAILGLAEIIHTVKLWIVASGSPKKRVLVVIPDDKDFPEQILSSYEEIKWQGSKLAEKIVVVDTLLCEESKQECKALAKKLGIEICSNSELCYVIIKEAE